MYLIKIMLVALAVVSGALFMMALISNVRGTSDVSGADIVATMTACILSLGFLGLLLKK